MMKKVLLFESKRLSYDSSWCFSRMLQKGLERLGIHVTVCRLEDVAKQEKELEGFCGQGFDAVFDINSAIVSARMDDKYYLDCFHAPFYHMIVDHPMHVHKSLQVPLQDYSVICLDQYHKQYIEQYYPHIRRVFVMPFGGIPAEELVENGVPERLPMEKRPFGLLFPATYTPLEYYRGQMETQDGCLTEIAEEILQEYRNGSTKTIDMIYREKTGCDNDFFTMKMYKARYMDRYIREWYREQILEALLQQDIVVDVVGFRWELYKKEGYQNLRMHEPCSYTQQLQMLGQSKMVLNVQPLFLDGVHDRVVNAMMNHSVAVTDSCQWIIEQGLLPEQLVVYDKNRPRKAACQIKELLSDPSKLESIEQNGYSAVIQEHSWYNRVKRLVYEMEH